jgi:putative tryptophan/tyrosine transport system substrate-binding protein
MRRRQFIAGLGGAAAWPLGVQAQQPTMPVIGFLGVGIPTLQQEAAFSDGLAEVGYFAGRNVAIEYRGAATGQLSQLPELASELVRRQVAVIAAVGSTSAALAAKAATTTIPIVFGNASDPVQNGLVVSLNRPGGNATGYSEMNTEVGTKRLGLLHELAPQAMRFGVLVNPKVPFIAEPAIRDANAVAATFGGQIEVLDAQVDSDIDAVFASVAQRRINALVVAPDPMFYTLRARLVMLAAHHAVPAVYWDRGLVEAGGLISYGSSVTDMYRQVAIYAARILKGAKAADLPVLQPTKFDLAINLKTAKALGLTIPETLLATADEVIQ